MMIIQINVTIHIHFGISDHLLTKNANLEEEVENIRDHGINNNLNNNNKMINNNNNLSKINPFLIILNNNNKIWTLMNL